MRCLPTVACVHVNWHEKCDFWQWRSWSILPTTHMRAWPIHYIECARPARPRSLSSSDGFVSPIMFRLSIVSLSTSRGRMHGGLKLYEIDAFIPCIDINLFLMSSGVNECASSAERANEWAVRANEQTVKRMAPYSMRRFHSAFYPKWTVSILYDYAVFLDCWNLGEFTRAKEFFIQQSVYKKSSKGSKSWGQKRSGQFRLPSVVASDERISEMTKVLICEKPSKIRMKIGTDWYVSFLNDFSDASPVLSLVVWQQKHVRKCSQLSSFFLEYMPK